MVCDERGHVVLKKKTQNWYGGAGRSCHSSQQAVDLGEMPGERKGLQRDSKMERDVSEYFSFGGDDHRQRRHLHRATSCRTFVIYNNQVLAQSINVCLDTLYLEQETSISHDFAIP